MFHILSNFTSILKLGKAAHPLGIRGSCETKREVAMVTKYRVPFYGLPLIVVLGALLSTVSTNTFAMNQEGHEDWMTDLPHAIALLEAIPEARPLPTRICPVTADMLARNQYEQIPLPRHRCLKKLIPTHVPTYPISTKR
jgi:hypothetical protein